MNNPQLEEITKKIFDLFPFDWIDIDQTCWGYEGELKYALHATVYLKEDDEKDRIIFQFSGTYEEFDEAIQGAKEGMGEMGKVD